jgi:hypothetical protein
MFLFSSLSPSLFCHAISRALDFSCSYDVSGASKSMMLLGRAIFNVQASARETSMNEAVGN